MRSGQVKIGPSYFAKVKHEYSDWRFALARELIQNSLDAKSSQIDITIEKVDDNTVLSFADNGSGMDEDIVVNKLLAIGESGKNFAGTVGGFGVACSLIYFTHRSYEIHTRDLLIKGCGADYTIEQAPFYLSGTKSTISIEGDDHDRFCSKFRSIIDMTQWGGIFTLNGETLHGRLRKGSFRKEFDWCKIYTNKSFTDRLIVRIGGIVMFTRYVDAGERCVIVELTGSSEKLLQSSRDSLKYEYQRELDELVRQITVDKNSAFRSDRTYYQHWEGDKFANRDFSALPEIRKLQDELRSMANEIPRSGEEDETVERDLAPVLSRRVSAPSEEVRRELEVLRAFRHDFVIRNDSGMQIPDYYKPGQFSTYSEKLVSAWSKLILECYRMFGSSDAFSVGFVFDGEDDTWAMFQRSETYGRVFYVNPAKVVQTSTGVRVLKKRWGFTPNLRYQLIVTAIHEYTHSCGLSCHDERYVEKLDYHMAIAMKNLKRFRACFP